MIKLGSGNRRRWIVLAAALGITNLLWNAQASVAPIAYPPRSNPTPLRITSVHTRPIGAGGTIAVDITVHNIGADSHQGRVWWQLAPARTSGGPWERRAYESRFRTVSLAGDRTAKLHWNERADVPAGTYEIHGWVDVDRNRRLSPSDGRPGVPPSIEITSSQPLLRHRPAPTDVVVTAVKTTVDLAGTTQSRVALRNRAADDRFGWVRWSITPVGGDDIAYWWRWADSSGEGTYSEVDIPGGEATSINLSAGVPHLPGRYALRLSLGFDLSTGFAPDDDVVAFFDVPSKPGASTASDG